MAVLIDTFRVCYDAALSACDDGTPLMKVVLAYDYGKRRGDNYQRPTQFIDAVMKSARAANLAQLVLQGAQVHAVIKDIHVSESATEIRHRKMEGIIIDLSIVVRAPVRVAAGLMSAEEVPNVGTTPSEAQT